MSYETEQIARLMQLLQQAAASGNGPAGFMGQPSSYLMPNVGGFSMSPSPVPIGLTALEQSQQHTGILSSAITQMSFMTGNPIFAYPGLDINQQAFGMSQMQQYMSMRAGMQAAQQQVLSNRFATIGAAVMGTTREGAIPWATQAAKYVSNFSNNPSVRQAMAQMPWLADMVHGAVGENPMDAIDPLFNATRSNSFDTSSLVEFANRITSDRFDERGARRNGFYGLSIKDSAALMGTQIAGFNGARNFVDIGNILAKNMSAADRSQVGNRITDTIRSDMITEVGKLNISGDVKQKLQEEIATGTVEVVKQLYSNIKNTNPQVAELGEIINRSTVSVAKSIGEEHVRRGGEELGRVAALSRSLFAPGTDAMTQMGTLSRMYGVSLAELGPEGLKRLGVADDMAYISAFAQQANIAPESLMLGAGAASTMARHSGMSGKVGINAFRQSLSMARAMHGIQSEGTIRRDDPENMRDLSTFQKEAMAGNMAWAQSTIGRTYGALAHAAAMFSEADAPELHALLSRVRNGTASEQELAQMSDLGGSADLLSRVTGGKMSKGTAAVFIADESNVRRATQGASAAALLQSQSMDWRNAVQLQLAGSGLSAEQQASALAAINQGGTSEGDLLNTLKGITGSHDSALKLMGRINGATSSYGGLDARNKYGSNIVARTREELGRTTEISDIAVAAAEAGIPVNNYFVDTLIKNLGSPTGLMRTLASGITGEGSADAVAARDGLVEAYKGLNSRGGADAMWSNTLSALKVSETAANESKAGEIRTNVLYVDSIQVNRPLNVGVEVPK